MSPLHYCVVWACLLGQTQDGEGFFSLQSPFDVEARGQSPDGEPLLPPPSSNQPGYTPYNPLFSQTPFDPFMTPGEPAPLGPPPPLPGPLYNSNSPQPYRVGWTPKLDIAYLPSAHTSPDVGNFSILEVDTELVYNQLVKPELLFSVTPQFGYRHWNASDSFTRDFFRLGVNLGLASPDWLGPWGWQANFNPSVNSDFRSSLASESINLDGNVVVHYRFNPQWTGVLGAGYLDRVENIIIPYAGVIYRPDDLWEFRILFPEGRISRYLGEFWWGRHWLYLQGQYHVDAFQMQTPTNDHNRVQYQDYRVTFGMRSDHKGFTKYIEAGWVFGRKVDFKNSVPDFDVSDGLIIRGGIRF